MFMKVRSFKDNFVLKNIFYNKNVDILFLEREYDFSKNPVGEQVFRQMILDSIRHFDETGSTDFFDSKLKYHLIDDYHSVISHVDSALLDKGFPRGCNDSYDKAIECGVSIYNKVNNLNQGKAKKLKRD